jgi:ABC-type sugar transport system substrate-binding protein
MKRTRPILIAPLLFMLASCNNTPDSSGSGGGGKSPSVAPGEALKIGYVLHGRNDFTAVIERGAKDAGKDLGVEVEVTGPSSFQATDAIAMFEGMVQKKKDGIAVVPMPGDVWVKPIKEAVDAGIPVATSNMTSPESASAVWVGQDEYQSGVILAQELRKQLEAGGKKGGKILAGICAPEVAVLQERYKGLKKGLEGSGFTVTEAMDVKTAPTENYAQWENLATANPDMVAAAGLCSMDVPNLAKLKARIKAQWLIGGYDLNRETLDAIKAGTAQVTLGQHPYLQGYLPVLALVRHLKDKKEMPKGWIDVGTEIVTKANVDALYPRETDTAAETKWYADHIAKTFADLAAMAKPLPKTH